MASLAPIVPIHDFCNLLFTVKNFGSIFFSTQNMQFSQPKFITFAPKCTIIGAEQDGIIGINRASPIILLLPQLTSMLASPTANWNCFHPQS